MPGERYVRFSVKDIFVEPDLFPNNAKRIMNAAMNKGFRAVIKNFFKTFVSSRLSGGGTGIKVTRRIVKRKLSGRGAIQIPAKARSVGFYGKLVREKHLEGKKALAGSSSPMLHAHEYGATIRPVHSKFLAVKIRTAAQYRKVFQRPFSKKVKLPFIMLMRRVVLKPKLGFYSLWFANEPMIFATLEKYKNEAIDNLNKRVAAAAAESSEATDGPTT